VRLGVVGLGERGRRLVAALDDLPQADVTWLFDRSPKVRLEMKPRYPHARVATELGDLLADESLDAIVLATPLEGRHELACGALEAHKHVFVDTLLASRTKDAQQLVRLAERVERSLVVGQEALFEPGARKLKELVELRRLGDLYYVHSRRLCVSRPRPEGVLWGLGARELPLILHLLDDEPVEVHAYGESYLQEDVPDVVFCHLKFATGITAHLHLSRIDPRPAARLTVVGSRRLAVFDAHAAECKLTTYEAGPPEGGFGGESGIAGDVVSPRLAAGSALRLQCEHFLGMIRSGSRNRGAGRKTVAVVSLLEALQRALDARAAPPASEQAPPAVIRLPLGRR
jgi:predicted dehydrogenase